MPWSTFLRNQDDSTMDLTELAVAMGSKWGPQAIACGGPSMVSVYNLLSKCGTTVRESPYTDTVLFDKNLENVTKFKIVTL